MDMQARIGASLKEAMKAKDVDRLSTLRLVNAAIKDREIALRGTESDEAGITDDVILGILGRMVKQRHESARAFEEGGRMELVARELAEITVIEEFLPRQLTEAESLAALDAAIAEVDATSIRDMGRVMAALKARYTGQMDFGRIGPLVKDRLG